MGRLSMQQFNIGRLDFMYKRLAGF